MYGEPKPPEPAGSPIPATSGTAGDARRPPRILVLDDSAAQRKLLVTLLRRWGFEATACADPEDALTTAQIPRSV
jgi:Response regulator containing CheY-like receiver, AAA-type ATPase, and DNA-binding domains